MKKKDTLEILVWMIKTINKLTPLGSGQTVKDMMRDEVVRKYKSITGIDIPKLKCTCGVVIKDGHTPDCELNQKTKWEKEFDKKFVKDLGDKIEPIFLDPNGSVGPIRSFILSTLEEYSKAMDKVVSEDWIGGAGSGRTDDEVSAVNHVKQYQRQALRNLEVKWGIK